MDGLRIVDPRVDSDWAELSACGSLFTSPPWMRALADTYSFEIRAALAAAPTGAAGLPFAVIADPRGQRVSALAFSDYCDPIGVSPDSWPMLADALLDLGVPVRIRCLHATAPLTDSRLELVGQAAWHAADVTRDSDEIWSSISSAARRGIRKARARGHRPCG